MSAANPQYLDLINRAHRLIGVATDGMNLTPYQLQNALWALNELIDAQNANELWVYNRSEYTVPLSIQKQTWTVGPGGDVNVPVRPFNIAGAVILQNASTASPTRIPLAILTDDEWLYLRAPAQVSNIPQYVYMQNTWPLGVLHLWPTPAVNDTQLIVLLDTFLTEGVALTDTVNLPPAYRAGLTALLAITIAPEYAREAPPTVMNMALKYNNLIANANFKMSRLDFDTQAQGTRNLVGSYIIASDSGR